MFGRSAHVAEKELSSRSLDYTATILDEIALEGLDGITLQGLWVRLGACPYFPMTIDHDSQKFIWEIVKRFEEVEMYELPTERSPLVLFNRFELVDHELGNVIEPDVIPEDIYPFRVVDDQARGIVGSCTAYDDRREITEKARQVTLDEASRKWGFRLVLVASQSVRSAALMGDDVDPCLEFTPMHFCILERIGRARFHGEVTQGKISLHCTGEDPKSLFYYRKTLIHHKLITKQGFNLKSNSQNCSGSLLHLPRFYSEHKSKIYFWTERVVDLLKSKGNGIAEYEEVRNEIGGTSLPKKLFKTPDFMRFVKSDKVPYRTIYPDAPRELWKHKGSDKEKTLRVVRLVNPNCSVKDEWVKEEEVEEEEEGIGYVDESTRMLDVPLMTQAFNAVDASGPNGLTQLELSKRLGMTKLQARTLCRNLLRKNLVSTFMHDVGRQRYFRYCSKRFDLSGHLSQEFHKERDKMLSLLSSKPNEKKRKVEDDEHEQNEKRRRIEEENGFDLDATLLSREEMAPLFLECVKLERPDLPFMEAVGDDDTDANGLDAFRATEYPGTSSDLFNELQHHSTPLMSLKKPRSRKRKTVTTEVSLQDPENDFDTGNPTEIVIAEDVSFIDTKDGTSSFTKEVKRNKNNKDSPAVTTRVLKRVNLIIEAVQQHTVIEDLTKLQKMIQEEEEREGMSSKIDRKSLHRLLEKLNKDGHIKTVRVHMKGAMKEKTLNFVCQPHVTVDHSLIQSALEQAKIKMFIPSKDNFLQMMNETREKAERQSMILEDPNLKFNTSTINESLNEMNVLNSSFSSKPNNENVSFKRSGKLGKQYGYQPKFVRMKTMHKLLFYLIHDYAGVSDLDQQIVKETLNDITPISLELEKELPQVYFSAIDWRMFIPPLPVHSGWTKGWAIMCDILLRLPLSIFLHLVNINYEVPGLDDYLSHPIRKHYLLKHLPPVIRNQLTAARRYIFNCHEVVVRLCYIGLVQFGPQKLKEKDQVFIFLNKNTSLMDTTTSSPGYHQISQEMDYRVMRFHFGSFQDVDQYWYQMWNICVNTPLGGRMCVSGKEITLETLENKPAMEAALQPRNSEEAPLLDSGDVPGDHCGAAGLDSALFAHLKRNWNWFNHVADSDIDGATTPVVNDHLPQSKKGRKVTLGLPVRKQKHLSGETISPKHFAPIESAIQEPESTPKSALKSKKRSSRPTQVRKVPLPKVPKRKPYYDSTDLEALTNMSKLRVEWTAPEDNVLLLFKVASSYLSPNVRNQLVSMQAWRDLLHRLVHGAKNKTSRAVQRRILYMMKNPSTARSVSLCLEEIKQDPKINKEFGNLHSNLKAQGLSATKIENVMNEKFAKLVEILQGRFQNMRSNSVSFEKALIPDSIEKLRSSYIVASPQASMRKKGKFDDVCEVADIHSSVINAMIYSSLCSLNDKTSYAYQLFKVYAQYPDPLLRSTMAKIRSDQMISLRRPYARTKIKSGQFLPVSNCPYQLSISYQHLLQTRFQYDIYNESFTTLQKLAWDMLLNTDVNGLEFLVVDGGSAATFIEYIIMDKLFFHITIPDQLIILDPRISGKDETYTRIVDRYRDILRKYKVGRDVASKADISASQKPFMEILSRDDVWDKEGDIQSDSEPANKKIKNAGKSNTSSAPDTPVSKRHKRQSSSELDGDLSESEDEDDETEKVSLSTPQCAVARAATRIALYMMREENEQSDVSKVQETQHAHDFFVVNSCKVVCRLKEDISTDAPTEVLVGIDPNGTRVKCAVSRSLLPVNAALASQVLDSIKRKAVFDGPSDSEDVVLDDLSNKGLDRLLMQALIAFTLSKKEMGASMQDMQEEFRDFKPLLAATLEALTDAQILLRTGVTKLVIVHYKKVRPWLIHSRKLLRLDREKLNPTDGKVVALSEEKELEEDIIEGLGDEVVEENNDDIEDDEDQEEAEEIGEIDEESVDDPDTTTDHETADTALASDESKRVLCLRNVRTKRGTARLEEGSPGSLNEIDSVSSDRIRVSIRPWIRVDGSVNRRVLDRLLGSALGYCMSNPGCSIEKIGERFSPGIQPYHSRELCEILQKLGCLQWKALIRSHKPTLFSKQRTITLVNADGTECESDICLEASADATLRLGLFIGDKAYKKDFLNGF